MALSAKLEALARMTDAFKTALYDQHVGREARCVHTVMVTRVAADALCWLRAFGTKWL